MASAREDGPASARLNDDWSSLVALAGPEGRQRAVESLPSSWPAPTRGRRRVHRQARTESVRPEETPDGQSADGPGSLRFLCCSFKAGLRPPSAGATTRMALPAAGGCMGLRLATAGADVGPVPMAAEPGLRLPPWPGARG